MNILRRSVSVIRWLLHRKRNEEQLNDELQEFIHLSAAQKVRDGLSPSEARRQAALELGGMDQVKEQVRTGRHGALLDEIGSDVRYALRMFRRNPAFILIVVITLALGIGANTAIFSLIDALMLRSLPVENPQELVQLQFRATEARVVRDTFSYPIVRALAKQEEIFAGVTGYSGTSSLNVGSPGAVIKVPGAMVSGNYYRTLGVRPAIGRLLTNDDDQPGAPPVAVISDGYWQRQFAGSPNVVGETLLINGTPVTIVGVSAPGFVGTNVGQITDITIPLAALPTVNPSGAGLLGPGNFWLRILARPKPEVSLPEVSARLNALWPELAEQVISPNWPVERRKMMADQKFEFAEGGRGWSFMREIYREPLRVLMAVVGLVLLIACANVASLLLARASVRQREIGVRLAIGAGRGRILRQLLVESLLLASIGSVLGIGLAWLCGRFLVDTLSTGPIKLVFDLTPNWHVLASTAAIAIATSILFGLAPALQLSAAGPSSVINGESRTHSSRSRLLPSLVSVQMALSLILLIAASLFVRTLENLRNFDAGFNRNGVLLVSIEQRLAAAREQELTEAVRQVPGVVSTSFSTTTPLSGFTWTEPAVPAGQPLPQNDNAMFIGIGPHFFATMQTTLAAGREFTERDAANSSLVAVVSEEFAQRFFPNQNPIGRFISTRATVGSAPRGQARDLEIVGIVKNSTTLGFRRKPYPTVYVSYAQLNGDFSFTLDVRANGSIAAVAEGVRTALQAKLPSIPVEVRSLSQQIDAAIIQERMMATLAGGFSVLALIVACIGLYGILAYSIARRTKEIGIRIALGARRTALIVMVLKGAVGLVSIGIVLGLPAAWAASRLVESMLFGLRATDPLAIGEAIILLIIAALLAAYLPARRASKVEPMASLRSE